MKKHSSLSKAFSLVELSVVIIIVGILIAGVTQGTRLIDEARLKTARDLTINSRVNSMEGLVLWYETSLVSSFSKTNAVDGAVVSQWNDNNAQSNTKLHAKAGQRTDNTKNTYNTATGGTSGNTSGPTYIEDGVNHIPSLRFHNDNAVAFQYLAVDKEMKNIPQDSMTIVYVINYRGGAGYGDVIGSACLDSSGVASNSCLGLGYALFASRIDPSLVGVIYYDSLGMVTCTPGNGACATNFTMTAGKKYIVTLQRNYGVSFDTYVNGKLVGTSPVDSGASMTLAPFKIGRNNFSPAESMDIDLSEFIFFSGAIKKRDRQEIERYLGKKYDIIVSSS